MYFFIIAFTNVGKDPYNVVRNFEWSSIYGTDRSIAFFRKFRITCLPRAVNQTTSRLGKKTPGKAQSERHDEQTKPNGW